MVMEARSIARYVRISTLKADRVLKLIRGQQVDNAQTILAHTTRPIAIQISKILTSAVANASVKDEELDVEHLWIKEAVADPGPTQKRIRPRAQGRANRILKRTSHIRIVVEAR
jgi:large subunit ribosomal protein L22